MRAHARLARLLIAIAFAVFAAAAPARAQAPDDARIRALLDRLEQALQRGSAAQFESLLASSADPARVAAFTALELQGGSTRVVVQERDRQHLPGTLPGNGYRLAVDAFIEAGDRAHIATIQLDIKLLDGEWFIADQERLSIIENLYRLSVTPTKQFTARNVKVAAEDLELTFEDGNVFVVETERGITGLIFIGRGELAFRPAPETEQGQVRIFAGAETLTARFEAAYLRTSRAPMHLDLAQLTPRLVDGRDLRRAQQIFREESAKSFAVDLADLTRDTWSLLPSEGDFLAEVRTRRFGTLTYSRSRSEPEDISLFDRRRGRTISAYASVDKLAARGRFYNEDDLAAYDVLDYDIDMTYTPERRWIEGRTTLRLRAQSVLGQITLRLARSLVVSSVTSDEFGRLFHLRVRNQDTVLVNLPVGLGPGTPLSLTIAYAGRLEPQAPDQETQEPDRDLIPRGVPDDIYLPRPEPSYLYSNRSHWYPQSPITDYATASLRIAVPTQYTCIAAGHPAAGSPMVVPGPVPAQNRRVFSFTADRPARYLSFVVSRLSPAERSTIAFAAAAASSEPLTASQPAVFGGYEDLQFTMHAQPRQVQRGRDVARQAADIARFYQSIIGDSPYQSFTLAVLENLLPGGHSPPYFAILNQPLAGSPLNWRNDPASFSGYPEFFIAHEVAHQWWGQAVGWRNYHEQWLSEGFAQYFAALYAQQARGQDTFDNVMRQMRRGALEQSDQGPIYLGYRLGHVRNESRVFRALVYNKGAAVLHMLRRLIGDEAFFGGVRRFYTDSRFRKAGTEDLRQAMEAESGRPLERFFERWIYGASLPRLRFSYAVEAATGDVVVLRFEQDGDLFDVPVTVQLEHAGGVVRVPVPVTERTVEVRVPLPSPLRGVDIASHDGTLAEIVRRPS